MLIIANSLCWSIDSDAQITARATASAVSGAAPVTVASPTGTSVGDITFTYD
jgi:hypothetical protein